MPVDAITRRLTALANLEKARAAQAAKRAAQAVVTVMPGVLVPPEPKPQPKPKPKRRRGSGKAIVRPKSAAVVSSKPVGDSVTFRCAHVPALGVALPVAGLISFQNGLLTLDDPDDIAVLRKNPWYGTRIVEVDSNVVSGTATYGISAPVRAPVAELGNKGDAGDGVVPGTGDGPASSAGTEATSSVPPAASRPDGGAMLMYKKFLVQGEAGGFKCSLCEPVSPTFPTEMAAIQHVFRGHSSQEVNRGEERRQ